MTSIESLVDPSSPAACAGEQPPLLGDSSPEPGISPLSPLRQRPESRKLGKATVPTRQLLPPPDFVLAFWLFSYSIGPARAGAMEAYLDSVPDSQMVRAYYVPDTL